MARETSIYRTEAKIPSQSRPESPFDTVNRYIRKTCVVSPGSNHGYIISLAWMLTKQKCILSFAKSACELMDATTRYVVSRTE